jgi:hypothetical protein
VAAKIAGTTSKRLVGGFSQERSEGVSDDANLTGEVAFLGRALDVSGGLDHRDVEVLVLPAAAVHLDQPDRGGVLDGAVRLAPALVHRCCAHLAAAPAVLPTTAKTLRGWVAARRE